MQIETFEYHEIAEETVEVSQEAIELIKALGLDGQKDLVCNKSDECDGERSPYREMTTDEHFVYKTLCPVECDISKYCASSIPLRVLQVASHAKSLGICKRILVWDRDSAVIKDPVLVGSTVSSTWESGGKWFILARWGEELEAFSILKAKAIEAKRAEIVEEAKMLLDKVSRLTDAQVLKGGAAGYIHSSY